MVLIIFVLQPFLNFSSGYVSSPQTIIESNSLKEALKKANDGDTMILLPGVYFEYSQGASEIKIISEFPGQLVMLFSFLLELY